MKPELAATVRTIMGKPLDLAPAGVMGPTGRSYWVVEHRFAAGAYPGQADE